MHSDQNFLEGLMALRIRKNETTRNTPMNASVFASISLAGFFATTTDDFIALPLLSNSPESVFLNFNSSFQLKGFFNGFLVDARMSSTGSCSPLTFDFNLELLLELLDSIPWLLSPDTFEVSPLLAVSAPLLLDGAGLASSN